MKNSLTLYLLFLMCSATIAQTPGKLIFQDGGSILEHPTCQVAVGDLTASGSVPLSKALSVELIRKGYHPFLVSKIHSKAIENSVESELKGGDLFLAIHSGRDNSQKLRSRYLRGDLLQVKQSVSFERAQIHSFEEIAGVAPVSVNNIKVPWTKSRHRSLIGTNPRKSKNYQKAFIKLVKQLPDCQSTKSANQYADNYDPTAKEVELKACLRRYRELLDPIQTQRRRRSETKSYRLEEFAAYVAMAYIGTFPPLGVLGILFTLERVGILKMPWSYQQRIEVIADGHSIIQEVIFCHQANLRGESCDSRSARLLQNLTKRSRKILKKLIDRAGGFNNFSERLASHIVTEKACSQTASEGKKLNIRKSLREVRSGL